MKKFLSITKANSYRIHQNRRRFRLLTLGVGLLLLVVLIPSVLFGVVSLAVTPAAKLKTWFNESTAALPSFIRSRQALIDRLNELENDLAAQSGPDFTLEALEAENALLRSLLGEGEERRILAGIIGRPSELPYDLLLIDRGRKDGVEPQTPVYSRDNTVIGIVRNVAERSSLVELISTPGFETTVFIFGPDIYTTAIGQGGGQVRVGVPQGVPLSVGDLVVLPAIHSGVYGSVTHIESSPTQPEQFGFVSTQQPLAGLRFVSVGRRPLQPIAFEEAQAILREQRESLFTVPVPEDILIELDTASSTATGTEAQAESIIEFNDEEEREAGAVESSTSSLPNV